MNKPSNSGAPERHGGRSGIVLIWVVCILMASMGAMTLQAANTTVFGAFLLTGGGPIKGESGWINLPYVRGVVPLDPQDGEPLFRRLQSLRINLTGKVVSDDLSAGGSTLVVEGRDGNLLLSQLIEGSPTGMLVDLGNGLSQGLLYGPLVVRLDPAVIRPELNGISLSLPPEFLGGVVRVTGKSIEDCYGLIEEDSLEISWGTMLNPVSYTHLTLPTN